ncbi:alpha/beta hydrolase [Sporomusa sp. KB1]|jgi:acetyl esterase/lipase|uniref:alpha/beta hydrolase n=1 Tax=Sporomusa sp. KB1 TaxID=943346 RepID=UPI0011AB9D8D|nr:alpha/beta hydrolase [Sporomusa sp. KB1]TWH51910.1 acetyl esterase/lipase [Sporomusa sp. KB1]
MKFVSRIIAGSLFFGLMLVYSGCAKSDAGIDTSMEEATVMPESISRKSSYEGKSVNDKSKYAHVKVNNTISDIVKHPAFEGFGQFILPLTRGHYDENMQLNHVSSLLPYHNNVDPVVVVDTINYMIDKVQDGDKIFYPFYTAQQVQVDPSKKSTGLFFFKGEPRAPFAVVCPGGGFSYVGSVHEGFSYAITLSQKGYNAFVIQYRVGSEKAACEDLAAAISYIFRNAELLNVATEDYSVWGSSAGARMAANIGSYGPSGFGYYEFPKPSTVVMAYTGHSTYTKDDPPTFVAVGENDQIANPAVMKRRANVLREAGVAVEFHQYPNIGHGFGLGIGTTAEGWLEAAVQFGEEHMGSNNFRRPSDSMKRENNGRFSK